MNHQGAPISAGLYLVATPIGNARDITLRALDLLAGVDMLVAEDTRTLRKLLQIHGIALNGRRITACHDHSGEAVLAGVVAAIWGGASVAYMSEAGTPLISDPGFTLGRAVQGAGLPVTAAPGASAVLTALTVAGLPAERFLFAGFLPTTSAARRAEIAELGGMAFTIIFYESAKRLHDLLGDLCEVLGDDREGAVCRELTKRFEEVRRGSLRSLADHFGDRSVKGECVVMIGPALAPRMDKDTVMAALTKAMLTMRMKDAATAVAGSLGLPRRDVYQIALTLGDSE
jgi:16S rRNA (cytidine1402-2'-O)-methyltransferase